MACAMAAFTGWGACRIASCRMRLASRGRAWACSTVSRAATKLLMTLSATVAASASVGWCMLLLSFRQRALSLSWMVWTRTSRVAGLMSPVMFLARMAASRRAMKPLGPWPLTCSALAAMPALASFRVCMRTLSPRASRLSAGVSEWSARRAPASRSRRAASR